MVMLQFNAGSRLCMKNNKKQCVSWFTLKKTRHRETGSLRERETQRRDRETERQRDRETERQRDRETERQRD
jgi:hypothetical protein